MMAGPIPVRTYRHRSSSPCQGCAETNILRDGQDICLGGPLSCQTGIVFFTKSLALKK